MMDGTESRIHCIAIDDEPLALDVVSKFCERHGSISLTVYSNPEEGIAAIKETHPDLVFLDIEMENMTGLTIAAQIDRDICVIFTTAYLNYALEGFNLDAVDYLHKPFSFTRFQTAIEKAVRRIEYNRTALASNSITVKQEYSNVNIPFQILSISRRWKDIQRFSVGTEYALFRASFLKIYVRSCRKNILSASTVPMSWPYRRFQAIASRRSDCWAISLYLSDVSIRMLFRRGLTAGECVCRLITNVKCQIMNSEIQTKRMILRPWRLDDAEALYRYASDERVSEQALWPKHTSVEMSREVIGCFFMPNPHLFAVVLKTTDEPVGCIGLVPEGEEHYRTGACEREVGYWIGFPYWGQGLITEALDAFIVYCRDRLKIESLLITTDSRNHASQRVAAKCGFRFVDDYKYNDIESKAFTLRLTI